MFCAVAAGRHGIQPEPFCLALQEADTVRAECGRIRYFFGQAHAQEPAVNDVNPDFFHQTAFGRDPEQVSGHHHFNQADRSDGRMAVIGTVQMVHGITDEFSNKTDILA